MNEAKEKPYDPERARARAQELSAKLLRLSLDLKRAPAPSWKEGCRLCGRVFSFRFLRRCYRCGKLHCQDCVTKDPTEVRNLICLKCAKRLISPSRLPGKYTPLSQYLAQRARHSAKVRLTLDRIEGIIGDNLPLSATRNAHWWNNSRSSTQGQAWLDVRWRVYDVDLGKRTISFMRPEGLKEAEKKQGKHKKKTEFVLPPKPRRPRRPSKTRVARAYARLKNIERRRSSMRQYRGKFKPKTAFEKRLYKPEAKPTTNT